MSVLKLEWIRQAVNIDFCQPFFFFFLPLIRKTVEFFLLLLFFLSPSSLSSLFPFYLPRSFTQKIASSESSFLIVIH